MLLHSKVVGVGHGIFAVIANTTDAGQKSTYHNCSKLPNYFFNLDEKYVKTLE